jgi:uncharacterized membrane protein HdeD (DUF308 family)
MNLTSEQVHWIYGGALTASALLLMLRESGRLKARWLDYVTPTLLLAFGVELLLDPLVHGSAAPADYAAETAQHFVLGLFLIATGAAEIVRLRRGGEGWKWRLPLAAALMIGAGIFAFHAQHDSNVPMILLQAQHRVIAATLALASLVFLLAPPGARGRAPSAFSALLLLLGLEFLLYTEGNFLVGMPMAAHEMPGH